MDVDNTTFWANLPHMLNAIRNARFISIDAEMTGISSGAGRYQHTASGIQDVYAHAKKAAETRQIAQVGFTCCYYTEGASEYTTTSFNCSVSPLFPKGSFPGLLTRRLGRKFVVDATSFSFLRDKKMHIFQALENGVPYLRRDEEQTARQLCGEGLKPDARTINIERLDEPSQAFYNHCRYRIALLKASPILEPIVIWNTRGDKINNFQARLVHQLMRDECPEFVAKKVLEGTSEYMIVRRLKESDGLQAEAQGRANLEDVRKLTGLRIIFEALAGGSFAEQKHRDWGTNAANGAGAQACQCCGENFDAEKCEAALREERPVLVGHNMFYDLVFVYSTFFGPLPASVDDFLRRTHELFPRLADTKYMYTRGRHGMRSDMCLEELQQSYEGEQFPYVSQPAAFEGFAHHAGYDSALTMNLFLKQAYSLLRREEHLAPVSETVYRPKNSPDVERSNDSELTPKKRILDAADEAHLRDLARSHPPLLPTPASAAPSAPSPGENRSAEETHVLPAWPSPFWEAYGNKTRVAGAGGGTVSFV